ncbi:MAG: tRNA (adenosine(37)-N6)-threonylcarbamoyltransferase complex dimerization subunit type 1 TsaB [Bacteroidales bacterium]
MILHIETSTQVCSVGLSREGEWLAVREDRSKNYSHSALLTVFMEEVMKEAAVTADEVDAVAVSRGPGSYTGLRIGVSAAKGFCYAMDIPLIAVDTLKALAVSTMAFVNFNPDNAVDNLSASGAFARNEFPMTTKDPGGKRKASGDSTRSIPEEDRDPGVPPGRRVLWCPMIDARRMEVYYALLTSDLEEVKSTAAEVITEQSFKQLLEHQQVIFSGDGAEKCRQVIDSPNAVFVPDSLPSVGGMLSLAEDQFKRKDFVDVAYFEPRYLKDFVAGKPKVKGLYS